MAVTQEETNSFLVANRSETPQSALTLTENVVPLLPLPQHSTIPRHSTIARPTLSKLKNDARLKTSKEWYDLIRFKYSILPYMGSQMAAIIAWSTLVCVLYKVPEIKFLKDLPNSVNLALILGTSVSLLLAFRTNTAYDRWWEGRRLWGNVKFRVLDLARVVKVTIKCPTPETETAQKRAFHLLQAIPYAIKAHLRQEPVEPEITNLVPDLDTNINDPITILYHIQSYIIDSKQLTRPLCDTVNALGDTIASLERIRHTPVPRAYACHLQQVLFLYLAGLPFQFVPTLGWCAIPATVVSAYIMLALRMIAQKIEDPFGRDKQDLPLEAYCEDVKMCVEGVMARKDSGVQLGWSEVVRK
ncbi:hypothetical protein HDU79_005440 [Rhizoclosmatium sp. JEL0117]|nr:hypothetical protein HDU79_005440 [Rhizoclosmatium sp. JEL0117]